jgi:N utilization substance protein A
MEIIVPDDQLSLAIGKKGQNVRLAAKLIGWKIDIKSESRAQEEEQEDSLSVEVEEPGSVTEVASEAGLDESVAELADEENTDMSEPAAPEKEEN